VYLSARIINLARAASLALPVLVACATGACLTSCHVSSSESLNMTATKINPDGEKTVTQSTTAFDPDGTRFTKTVTTTTSGPAAADDRVTVDEVASVAEKADRDYVDGWIDGRDPRVFKSYYKTLTPMQKAEFAMAYHDMVEKSDQNLAQSYKTYIPYKVRVAFARKYWENSQFAAKFKSEIEKMQVAWIHESLLDGSELWWRAAEGRFGNRISSPSQMAHDVEQNMVSKYMEDEGTESTFSQQMTDKTKAKTKTN